MIEGVRSWRFWQLRGIQMFGSGFCALQVLKEHLRFRRNQLSSFGPLQDPGYCGRAHPSMLGYSVGARIQGCSTEHGRLQPLDAALHGVCITRRFLREPCQHPRASLLDPEIWSSGTHNRHTLLRTCCIYQISGEIVLCCFDSHDFEPTRNRWRFQGVRSRALGPGTRQPPFAAQYSLSGVAGPGLEVAYELRCLSGHLSFTNPFPLRRRRVRDLAEFLGFAVQTFQFWKRPGVCRAQSSKSYRADCRLKWFVLPLIFVSAEIKCCALQLPGTQSTWRANGRRGENEV